MSAEKEQKLQTETILVKSRLFTHQTQIAKLKRTIDSPFYKFRFIFLKHVSYILKSNLLKFHFLPEK